MTVGIVTATPLLVILGAVVATSALALMPTEPVELMSTGPKVDPMLTPVPPLIRT